MRALAAGLRPNFAKLDFAKPNFAKPKFSLGRVVWQGMAVAGLTALTGYTTGIVNGMGIVAALEIIRSGLRYLKEAKADLDLNSKPGGFLPIQNFDLRNRGKFS
ncbi:MAG: hypothetical protein V3T21_01160 [Candidatus Margulisiibacteriota bacterium]